MASGNGRLRGDRASVFFKPGKIAPQLLAYDSEANGRTVAFHWCSFACIFGSVAQVWALDIMCARVATWFALSTVALLAVSCASNHAWPPKNYTEVRAFLYNLDSVDSLPCISKGRLDASMTYTNGLRLTDAQVSRFLTAVTGRHPDHAMGGCYVPHHAYVFYDQKRRIVGWVELCLGCLNYRASSPSAPDVFDIVGLQDLTVELGLPVLKKDEDYLTLKLKDTK